MRCSLREMHVVGQRRSLNNHFGRRKCKTLTTYYIELQSKSISSGSHKLKWTLRGLLAHVCIQRKAVWRV